MALGLLAIVSVIATIPMVARQRDGRAFAFTALTIGAWMLNRSFIGRTYWNGFSSSWGPMLSKWWIPAVLGGGVLLWLAACGYFLWAAGAVRDPAESLGYVRPPVNAPQSPGDLLRTLHEAEFAGWHAAPQPSPEKQAALEALALPEPAERHARLAALTVPEKLDDPWLHWLHFKAAAEADPPAEPPHDVCTAFEWPALRAAGILAKVEAAAKAGGRRESGILTILDDYFESDPPWLAVLLVRHQAAWLALSHPLPQLYPAVARWTEENLRTVPGDPWLACCCGAAFIRTGRAEEGAELLALLKPGVVPDETAGTALLFRAFAARDAGDEDHALRLADGARLALPESSAMHRLLASGFPRNQAHPAG